MPNMNKCRRNGAYNKVPLSHQTVVDMKKPEPLIKSFKDAAAFGSWLKKNHAKSSGIWIKFFKKNSGVKSVVYSEALDEALCWGWIDSQTKTFDAKAYLQRFTPRRSRSIWSKRNRDHVARLVKEKRMQASGLAEVNAAKKDGRWEVAYDSPKNMEVPQDFLKELSKNKKAKKFFDSLNRANVYAIAWRLQTAKKPETHAKRLRDILKMLGEGKKFH
jgi:uncharacterized protein YdeI (YjbR/CyaY-like superfamily)